MIDMGLFDTLVARGRCPYCGFEEERGFQTKSLGCKMNTFKIGDKIEVGDFVIKSVIIKNCIEVCEKCDKVFYADFSAKDGRLQGLIKIKKKVNKKSSW